MYVLLLFVYNHKLLVKSKKYGYNAVRGNKSSKDIQWVNLTQFHQDIHLFTSLIRITGILIR